jgi:hypothetical protein
VIKSTLIAVGVVFLVAYNSLPSFASDQNAAGGAAVVSSAQTPITKATASLSLTLTQNWHSGQFAIADVISYGGSQTAITAPDGWELIRDDSTPTTRQSLYWHVMESSDSGAATWAFSEPVDAQGAILLLDNVATNDPIDGASASSGGVGGGILTAPSVETGSAGDLILAFNATDFGAFRPTVCKNCDGLNPQLPENASVVVNQESTALEYWILAGYQGQVGETADVVSAAPQLFNWVAAQVAIRQGS